jgi:hypothetical protein
MKTMKMRPMKRSVYRRRRKDLSRRWKLSRRMVSQYDWAMDHRIRRQFARRRIMLWLFEAHRQVFTEQRIFEAILGELNETPPVYTETCPKLIRRWERCRQKREAEAASRKQACEGARRREELNRELAFRRSNMERRQQEREFLLRHDPEYWGARFEREAQTQREDQQAVERRIGQLSQQSDKREECDKSQKLHKRHKRQEASSRRKRESQGYLIKNREEQLRRVEKLQAMIASWKEKSASTRK